MRLASSEKVQSTYGQLSSVGFNKKQLEEDMVVTPERKAELRNAVVGEGSSRALELCQDESERRIVHDMMAELGALGLIEYPGDSSDFDFDATDSPDFDSDAWEAAGSPPDRKQEFVKDYEPKILPTYAEGNARRVRIATWNMKTVAPRLWNPNGSEPLWNWAADHIGADVYVFTEAVIPKNGVPVGWNAIYVPGGVGPRRPWGTIIASPTLTLKRFEFPRNVTEDEEFSLPNPAATFTVSILDKDEVIANIVGTHGLMVDEDDGPDEMEGVLWEILDVLVACEVPVIVAGDFNLHPNDVLPLFREIEMFDVLTLKGSFDERPDGVGGTRIWTHRNTNNPGAKVQELDFIFVTEEQSGNILSVSGGVESFPGVFEVSDHAPVCVDLML